ncbi:MAG: hypothetical protein PHC51_10455 [bacterium]|nr:hypothetical protein [bacterium]
MKNSLTFIAYLSISTITMAFSGMMSSKTLYDTYYARQAGAIVSTSDLLQAHKFYGETLNLSPSTKPSGRIINAQTTYTLPGGSVIILSHPSSPDDTNRSNLLIRVRNGFQALHHAIVERSGNNPIEIDWDEYDPAPLREYQRQSLQNLRLKKPVSSPKQHGLISKIIKRSWGEEFVALDPDGNALTYYYESAYSSFSHQLRLEAAKVTRQSSPAS